MEVKFYEYGSTTQHAGSQCQQNVRSYNKRTVQKRWLTTVRTTFLRRLDSLCLHRQISLIRVYFLCYSNFGKFIFATEKESGNRLLFVMFYNERKSVEEQK